MESTMQAIRSEWGKQIDIRIIDVDDPKNESLIQQYKAFGTAIFVIVDATGKEAFRTSGLVPKQILTAQLQKVVRA